MAKIDIFGELHATTTDGIIADISQIRGADQLGVKDGSITKAKLDSDLQGAVEKANSAVQSVEGSNGVNASVSETKMTVSGVTANTNTVGVAKLHPAAYCTSFSSDDGGATPNAVRKAITDESVSGTFNATTEHRGTMSKEDKALLNLFSVDKNYPHQVDFDGTLRIAGKLAFLSDESQLVNDKTGVQVYLPTKTGTLATVENVDEKISEKFSIVGTTLTIKW